MDRYFFTDLFRSKERKLVQRTFAPQMLLSDAHHQELAANGYVHIPNVLSGDEIRRLLDFYEEIKKSPGFEKCDKFNNTFSFFDVELKKMIRTRTCSILDSIYPRVFNKELSAYPMGAAYCMSPPNPSDFFNPHQDPALIDESVSYSLQTWIPLQDVDPENGCLHVIPGSHLWGNEYRSVSTHSALLKFSKRLWEFVVPLPANAGDLICFDVATMHCSTKNRSNSERLAVATHVVPGMIPMQTFYYTDEKRKDKLDLIQVDGDYFVEGHLYLRPEARYPLLRTFNPDNYYSWKNIGDLVREFADRKK